MIWATSFPSRTGHRCPCFGRISSSTSIRSGESRAAGADAILLIAEVLSEAQIIDYQILATELGMTSLVEVHSIDNLYRVLNHVGFPHSGYSLLGVNNRDLSTMTTDLVHTFRMLDLIEDPRVLVSESGIRNLR